MVQHRFPSALNADYALGGSDPGPVLGWRRSPGYGLLAVAAGRLAAGGWWPIGLCGARSVPPAFVKRPRRACSHPTCDALVRAVGTVSVI